MQVRFTQLEIREVRIPFRFAFRHALAERREAHSLLLALHTDTGHLGYGEIVPRSYPTGESVESAWEDLAQRWWPAVRSLAFPLHVEDALAVLRPLYEQADREGRTASYAGLDIAVVDAVARAAGIPGARLFGQTTRSELLTATLADTGFLKTVWVTRLFRWLGFTQFKLKVGGPDDLVRARLVRNVLPARADLRVDANAAWTVEEAVARVAQLQPFGISSVEQPVGGASARTDPQTASAGLRRVQEQTGVPVMADESLCTRADAEALLGATPTDRVLLWNVRLAKVGGFSGARELIRLADAHGVGVQLGVLVGETAVLGAAQRALFGLTEFTHVEHGFSSYFLRRDPFRGAPDGCRGRGRPLRAARGLGVEPRPHVLAHLTVRQDLLR